MFIFLPRSSSWFWGWGKRGDNAQSNISLSGKNEEQLKKKLHQARLDVAKIEAKLTGNEHILQEHEAYSLEFKVRKSFDEIFRSTEYKKLFGNVDVAVQVHFVLEF